MPRPVSLSITSGWQSCPGPERGHVWHQHGIYPEFAWSRETADEAAALQHRTLILLNPGLTPSAAGATPTVAAATRCASGESAPGQLIMSR